MIYLYFPLSFVVAVIALLCSLGWPAGHYVDQSDLRFAWILLPLAPDCQSTRCVPPLLATFSISNFLYYKQCWLCVSAGLCVL